jgi:nitrite reductase (NADH) large subunit
MSAVLEENSFYADPLTTAPVVVIGTGPVGIRFVEELLQRKPSMPVVIYGNEPWEPYNRVRLASLLTGELNFAAIQNPLKLEIHHRVVQRHNCEVVAIDCDEKTVHDRLGNCQRYSRLVLATGSSPHIPNIEGIQRPGVFTFRNLDDAQQLIARRTRSRRALVLGGGLLGLEAARGLQKYNTEVTIIEHAGRLMARQLDDEAGQLLREHMLSQGIQVVLGDSVKKVTGEDSVSAVELRSGRTIDCDTLVIATGIQPNLELARNAGIAVGRGVRVNDQMQTSDPDVFAVGECAEHRDSIYGLVAPGLEQAGVAAHTIAGGASHYAGSQAATRLKVVGVSVFSAGRTGERDAISQLRSLTWRSYDSSCYRKLLLSRNRLVGVIAYGSWDESGRTQESVQRSRYIWPWQRGRFLRDGNLWPAANAANVNDWPASAIVCQCTNVNRGTLSKAVLDGHCDVEALCAQTGASSVCGSCKPLLAELVGGQAIEPEQGSHTLVWIGIVALLAALAMLLAPAIPFADSVQTELNWDRLWRDGLIKQISGFSLLGLGVLVSLISLRKRIKRISFGSFGNWRLVHVVLGTLAVAALIAHTGLRLGANLNLYLMLSFVGLLLVGAIASGVIGLQHLLPRGMAKRTRELSLWMHILLLWPLPALLGFHVLKTYWF